MGKLGEITVFYAVKRALKPPLLGNKIKHSFNTFS